VSFCASLSTKFDQIHFQSTSFIIDHVICSFYLGHLFTLLSEYSTNENYSIFKPTNMKLLKMFVISWKAVKCWAFLTKNSFSLTISLKTKTGFLFYFSLNSHDIIITQSRSSCENVVCSFLTCVCMCVCVCVDS
jgi:hypothetical protein